MERVHFLFATVFPLCRFGSANGNDFGIQLATRFRKPTLRNGYIWVMIPQVTSGSSALKQFLRLISLRWYIILNTKICTIKHKRPQHRHQRSSTSDFRMLQQHPHLHGKQVENLMRLLGNSREPRELHPSGRERRHHCLLEDVGAILFTRSSSVLFLNNYSCRFLVKKFCRAMRTWSPPAKTSTLPG